MYKIIATSFLFSVMSGSLWAKGIEPNEFRIESRKEGENFQIYGSFGSAWSVDEAKNLAREACVERSKKLTLFTRGKQTSRSGTAFVGVCE